MPFVLDEHREAVDVFMLSIHGIRYAPMGETLGVDIAVVIKLCELMNVSDPVETIEKVMYLSRELIVNAK